MRNYAPALSSQCAGAGPAHALYFAAYEQSKLVFGAGDDPSKHPIATGRLLFIFPGLISKECLLLLPH